MHVILVYVISVFLFLYFLVPSVEITITSEQMRNKILTNSIIILLYEALNQDNNKNTNLLFDYVKEYGKRIEEQAKEKENFFSCMSHEIRNPIQSLLGSLEIIIEKLKKGEPLLELIDICKSCCEMVLNLISNILDISKIQAGKMELFKTPSDPREAIMRIIRIQKTKAEGKGIFLKFNDCRELPPVLEIDSHKLSQVVLNVVGNAIKFTKKGGITIDVKWNPIENKQEKKEDTEEKKEGFFEEILHNEIKPTHSYSLKASKRRSISYNCM